MQRSPPTSSPKCSRQTTGPAKYSRRSPTGSPRARRSCGSSILSGARRECAGKTEASRLSAMTTHSRARMSCGDSAVGWETRSSRQWPGAPASTIFDVFGLTERGRVRTENQDQFLIASLHKLLRVHQSSMPPEDITTLVSESRGYILLVADGVGGRPDGQAASGTVVKTIANHVTHFTDLYRRLDSNNEANFVAELEKSVLKSHDALIEEGKKEFGGR